MSSNAASHPTNPNKIVLLCVQVLRGKQTPLFQAAAKAATVDPALCVSLVTAERSLDLQFDTEAARDAFAVAIERVVASVKKQTSAAMRK